MKTSRGPQYTSLQQRNKKQLGLTDHKVPLVPATGYLIIHTNGNRFKTQDGKVLRIH